MNPAHTVKQIVFTVAATILICALAGCGINPTTLTVPGTTVSGPTYTLHIQFTNALNLPSGAKVVANGAHVGNLEDVTVVAPAGGRAGYVVADIDVQQSVKLPTTTTAQLRQATLLGDIYIALHTPSDGFGTTLAPDATIPLAQTEPPMQIEDALAGIATFVQGGAMNQLQSIVDRMNSVLPPDPKDTARIFGVLGSDITDLAGNLQQVDAFLDAMTADAAVVVDNITPLTEILTAEGAAQVTNTTRSLAGIIGVFETMSYVVHSLVWLTPLLSAGNAAAKAFVPLALTTRPLDLQAPSNVNKLVTLLREKVIPFAENGPKLNITGVEVTDHPATDTLPKDDQVDQMITALRMIGAVR